MRIQNTWKMKRHLYMLKTVYNAHALWMYISPGNVGNQTNNLPLIFLLNIYVTSQQVINDADISQQRQIGITIANLELMSIPVTISTYRIPTFSTSNRTLEDAVFLVRQSASC